MSLIALVLPDFLLIGLGYALLHWLKYPSSFFTTAERLVYYCLFPSLLFVSILRAPLSFTHASTLIGATLAVCVAGMAMAWLAAPLLKPAPLVQGSLAQCAYRFNTYMGLSLALSLAGPQGQSIMAIIVGFAVPAVNVAAVAGLARNRDSRMLLELLRNPFILATLAGLACNVLELHPPGFALDTLQRLGAAAIVLGLICVGASLSMQGLGSTAPLIAWMVAVRLLAMPMVALLVCRLLPLSPTEQHMLLLFSALPTASASYILASRMGGDGRSVAATTSIATIFSAITIPLWLQFAPS